MRWVLATFFVLSAALSHASRILLIPLDSRPAAGQFAQMIGSMAGAEVQMPPYDLLGRFTTPGSPEAILAWLRKQDFSDVSAVVVSTDMIAYGGLMASRTPTVPVERALQRLDQLEDIAAHAPNTQFYGFSAIMRLSPTAMKSTNRWRGFLATYFADMEHADRSGNASFRVAARALLPRIPKGEIDKYKAARSRDHAIQRTLIRMARDTFSYLVLGQDDAQPYGPHIPERKDLAALVDQLGIAGRVYFCEGVDQDSNVLVSRALLKAAEWTPRVAVEYSDPEGRHRVAAFESKSIEESLRDQILASGARPAVPGQPADYTIFVNTPGRREGAFDTFVNDLQNAIDADQPVSLADIDLNRGQSDPELFTALQSKRRLMKLLSYAGWNTAGNTMGTAIPAANMALLARLSNVNPVKAEVAQKEFLLHRIVDDVLFHRYTRPKVYALIRSYSGASPDETYGDAYTIASAFVRKDVVKRLEETFSNQLSGLEFPADNETYSFTGLTQPRVFLPWPRAYEMRLDFGLNVQPSVGHG